MSSAPTVKIEWPQKYSPMALLMVSGGVPYVYGPKIIVVDFDNLESDDDNNGSYIDGTDDPSEVENLLCDWIEIGWPEDPRKTKGENVPDDEPESIDCRAARGLIAQLRGAGAIVAFSDEEVAS